MAATGTLKKALHMGGEGFPAFNSRNNPQKVAHWPRETMKFRLTGYTAAEVAANGPYTYTLFTVGATGVSRLEGKYIVAAFAVSPEGLAADVANYNTFALAWGGHTPLSKTTQYGVLVYEPSCFGRLKVETYSILAAEDVVTLVVTGTLTSSPIADGTEIWLILSD